MPKVALLEYFPPEIRPKLAGLAGEDMELVFCASNDDADRAAALAGAEYALVRAVKMPAALLDAGPDLKMIHQWGTGTDGIPIAEARARGLAIARSPGINAPSVADLALALMLACLRRVCVADRLIRDGAWAEPDLYETGRDLTGATVGLVGYGAIAKEVEKRLAGFDCEVLHSRASGGPGATPFEEMLPRVDILSLHAPSTPATRHLLNAQTLARMKPGAVIVNTARGDLIDEAALAAALASGQIGAAGLDAFDPEPLPPGAPIRSAPNTVFTAHAGGRTRDNFARIVRHWAGNIRAHAAGEAIDPACLV
ncbi:NAD(P)-dependent oxidoreductase [Poseidonocella sp. HB161398]|uniref:NAD(P)-dependent oxidoreductase n=1 Tax=Poseidonocella sp. HB161398 TaxID=2320855 RepID=UPI001108957C|nr:NAD(P)-dependent oxidoreductase [Poseidonocella sp. HB161398]